MTTVKAYYPDKHTPKYKVSSACPNHLHNYYTTQIMQEGGFTPNPVRQKREKPTKQLLFPKIFGQVKIKFYYLLKPENRAFFSMLSYNFRYRLF